MKPTVCGVTLGAAIVATFLWPELVVTFIAVFAGFLVLGTIAAVIWEQAWQRRNDQRDDGLCERAVRAVRKDGAA